MVVMVIGNFPVCAIQEERRQDRVYKAVKIDIKSGFANEGECPSVAWFYWEQNWGSFQNFFAGSLMEELLLYCAEFPFGIERFSQLRSLTILPM